MALAAGGAASPPGDWPVPLDPSGRVWKTSLVCAVYLAGAIAFFHGVWAHPASVMQFGPDQVNFTWYLQWTAWAIAHGHNPLFSNYLNYPYGINLVSNAGVVGLGVLFAPVTWLFGPVASFNAIETLSLVTGAIGGFFFVLRWAPWRPAAFVGGLVFGFSPYVIAQTGHIHLTVIVLLPIILLLLHEIVVRQSWPPRRAGLVLGVLCVLQYFISNELLFDTAVVGASAVIVAAAFGRKYVRAKLPSAGRALSWAVGLTAVLLAYPVWFSLVGPAHINGLIQPVPQAFRADFYGLVVPDSRMEIAPAHYANLANHYASSAAENGSYLGVTLLLVILVGVVVLWRRSVVVRIATITAIVAGVLSLGAGLALNQEPSLDGSGFPLPGRLLARIPLLDNALPGRYSVFCALMAALLLGVILTWVRTASRNNPSAALRMAPLALAVVALVPLIPAPLTGVSSARVPPSFTAAADLVPVGSVALVYPLPSDDVPLATFWQAVTDFGFKQVGTSIFVPGANGRLANPRGLGFNRDTLVARAMVDLLDGKPLAETPAHRAALLAELRTWHVATLVALPDVTSNPNGVVPYFTWLFGRAPTHRTGVAYTWSLST